jgi:photosystem II stability/assembly factor-like uncharacterized protein
MGWRTFLLAAACCVVALSSASAASHAPAFSRDQPLDWVSVAAGQPQRVWVENIARGWLSDDGGRTFSAPLSAQAFQRAHVAQATMLADGKTLLGMPTVWSTDRFTPPRWSSDGKSWQAGVLHGKDAHYDFGRKLAFVGETPVTADPSDGRTAWFCQGNLYVTHDAGRTWSVAKARFRRPWHCSAVAISQGKPHTMLLLAQSGRNTKHTLGRILRSTDSGATWRRVKSAPRYPSFDYNGHALAFDPAQPATVLMIAANGSAAGALYRSVDRGAHWKQVRPAGSLRSVVVDQFAFASDGRTLALVRVRGTDDLLFSSPDGGLHWSIAPRLTLDTKSVYASPLAASGSSFLLGTTRSGFWRLGTSDRRWVKP